MTDKYLATAKHTGIIKELYRNHPMLEAKDDSIQKTYIFERKFKVHTPSKEDWIQNVARVNYRTHVYFTDGSVYHNGSGYGALYAPRHCVIKGSCGRYSSIFQAEIAAIYACCMDARTRRIHSGISIYSDSLVQLKHSAITR